MRRFLRFLKMTLWGPEPVVAYRLLKADYWFGGYYIFNTESPNTTFTRTFRGHPLRATEVPNPFYWPGLAEEVRRTMEQEEGEA